VPPDVVLDGVTGPADRFLARLLSNRSGSKPAITACMPRWPALTGSVISRSGRRYSRATETTSQPVWCGFPKAPTAPALARLSSRLACHGRSRCRSRSAVFPNSVVSPKGPNPFPPCDRCGYRGSQVTDPWIGNQAADLSHYGSALRPVVYRSPQGRTLGCHGAASVVGWCHGNS
jgi:hypothetical protein